MAQQFLPPLPVEQAQRCVVFPLHSLPAGAQPHAPAFRDSPKKSSNGLGWLLAHVVAEPTLPAYGVDFALTALHS